MSRITLLLCLFIISDHVYAEKKLEERVHAIEGSMQKLEAKVDLLTVEFKSLATSMSNVMEHLNMERHPGKEGASTKKSEKAPAPIMNDTNLEERVTALEFQMENVHEDITTISTELTDLEEDIEAQITIILADISIIQSDQSVQDQRLLDIEDDIENTETEIVAIENSLVVLEATDIALNTSIVQLESRVTALEGLNITVEGLVGEVENLDETVMELVSAVEALDVSLENMSSRISKLELSGTIAFHVFLGEYTSIPVDSIVVFNDAYLNHGNGFDDSTGQFTVPTGEAGLYFFYVHFWYSTGEVGRFNIRHNGVARCTTSESEANGGDFASSSCGITVILQEGDTVHIYYQEGTDDTPLTNDAYPRSSFSGFRIAPQ